MTIDDKQALAKAAKIKLLILDVDGVLTDGTIFIADDGSEHKVFNSKDGVAIKMLVKSGIEIAIISGRESAAVRHRLEPFGVRYIHQKQDNKLIKFNELKSNLNLTDEQIAYVGDDLPDLAPIIKAGLGIVVADGDKFTQQHADWITTKPGGRGAVREVCELIMKSQNRLAKMRQYYFGL